MSNGTGSAPGLTFSRDTFAAITPDPFLLAHLKQEPNSRPNGRKTFEARQPVINTGSLTHSNGSAVVRVGDTAIVCGVRGEILLASDIPHAPNEDLREEELIEELGLLVPNIELGTGCSPAHLPGNSPSTLAQSLSYRVSSLLQDSRCIDASNLCIKYTEPNAEDEDSDDDPKVVTKAYWTLYIDVLCLALDGNAFDAAWLAIVAALRDTTLPKAWWDQDREQILCSPLLSDASALTLNDIPSVSTFAVYTTASPLQKPENAQSWVLADPDAFEEEICHETLTLAVRKTSSGGTQLLKIEKSGGSFIGQPTMRECVEEAGKRLRQSDLALKKG
ncbi:Exosome complex component rrp43 [Fulvia fulva]|uniref:Ribosomal RNA-processing protein 43 n=1 Tax=Passalora fulva TaxID=5499 RepID=A0A9Q8LA81_PASFU|nr:Exosome complex component rrp43 [Fulvia fulva]KAK4636054.1 Exosome complex component rrp43 [Fulvia fulva]KAK4636840.1 Exosome complex component rrp43 [Fulvia fulva]UJO13028.1 Exosome complex component rrp43 [Fulvia fulva]WPV08617.1 Exosome complex component rrp43 [Fulvia fulva]WPV23605.1 Exosome complex component rrp43 [Fulvia fulva]